MTPTPPLPLQPLFFDSGGIIRFEANSVVRFLLEWATERGMGLNELARGPFPAGHREQFAQLIGYSVAGFNDLSYVSDETWGRVEKAVAEMPPA